MLIDLRSDTITKPTPGMLEAMFKAEVGDDVFGEDPTVRSLERRTADIFGMDAGLFCPSGTMANQIAIRILTNPQDELICDAKSHIQNYEGGGIAYNSFVTAQTVYGEKGKLNADLIIRHIKPDNIHFPVTSLVAVENTVNKGGGSIYTLEEIAEIYSVCRQYGLKLHLDGARLFNALVETGEDPRRYGRYFDTITISLSKGLGAPVGSVLIMKEPYIKKAKRVRKVLGGGMRQAGYLAAAGIYALDHHVDRLAEDHQRAQKLSDILNELPWISAVTPPVTNILICSLPDHLDPTQVLNTLKASGILGVSFGGQDIRFVTHLDFTDPHMEAFSRQIKALNFP